jgi:amidohydrolase
MTLTPSVFHQRGQEHLNELVGLRHELHAHPELAYQESRTAARILDELGKIPNLKIRSGLAGTGIVATLNRDRDGPCVALRAELDALPIEETTSAPYRSMCPGSMHACGHDGHMTCLVGAARVLSAHAEELPGRVRFIFQPAEEHGAGAARMIEEGALDDPKVDAIFALHGWPEVRLGAIAVGAGPVMAGTNTFDLIVRGPGTHAASPHKGADVIAAAAQIIAGLQAIPSRRIDPVEPVVVSVCQLSGGQTYNVLPSECSMKGTIRALRTSTIDGVREQLRQLAERVAAGFGAETVFTVGEAYPPLVNHRDCAALVGEVATELLGASHVVLDPPPSLGAEDFAYYAQRVPAAFYRLGLGPADARPLPGLHNPSFDFNDAAIPLGVAMHCGVAYRYLIAPPTSWCG